MFFENEILELIEEVTLYDDSFIRNENVNIVTKI